MDSSNDNPNKSNKINKTNKPNKSNTNPNKINNLKELSISGGGVRGYAYLGVLYHLDALGLLSNLEQISGVSIGSLFAVGLAIGWKPSELIDYLFEYDISKVKDIDIKNFFSSKSFLKGLKYRKFIEDIVQIKTPKETTLKQLYEKTKINLVIATACINDQRLKFISHETDPDIDLVTLIMMSSSIPGLFPPVEYKNKLYIDGAILDNSPKLVSNNGLGICQECVSSECTITGVHDFFGNILYMVYDNLHIQQTKDNDPENWIKVKYGEIQVTSFNITKDEKLSLIMYGIDAAKKYFVV